MLLGPDNSRINNTLINVVRAWRNYQFQPPILRPRSEMNDDGTRAKANRQTSAPSFCRLGRPPVWRCGGIATRGSVVEDVLHFSDRWTVLGPAFRVRTRERGLQNA